MYWLEKNQVRDNWNVLFVDFIRREWVKENSENKGLPVCIDENWSPSSDAFDILELANVSKNDALKHKNQRVCEVIRERLYLLKHVFYCRKTVFFEVPAVRMNMESV